MPRFNPWIVFILAAILILLGRVPMISAPPWDIDEGLYAAVGQALSRGELLYVDVWDNKPPAIYFLFEWLGRISSDYTLPRLVATAVLIATAGVVFYLARKTLSQAQAYAALAIFSFLAIVPIFETHVTNAEIFLILPSSLAILLTVLIEWFKWDRRYYVLIGALVAAGFLFKTVALLDGLAVLIFLLLRYKTRALRDIGSLVLGGAAVLSIPAVYLIGNNLTQDFIRAAFLNNFGYIRQGNITTISFIDINNPLITLGGKIAALAGAVILIAKNSRKPSPQTLFYLWFAFALFGAFLSGRPYLHYLITAIPPAALLAPRLISQGLSIYRRQGFHPKAYTRGLALATAVILALVFGFAGKIQFILSTPEVTRAVQGYYANAYSYLTGQISQREFFDFYGEVVGLNFKLTEWLKDNSSPTEPIYIWGNAPWVYYLSGRPHTAKYLSAYHLTFVKEGSVEVLAKLQANPPRLIIVTNEPSYVAEVGVPTPSFPEFEQFLVENYRLIDRVAQADIFERNYLAHAGTP